MNDGEGHGQRKARGNDITTENSIKNVVKAAISGTWIEESVINAGMTLSSHIRRSGIIAYCISYGIVILYNYMYYTNVYVVISYHVYNTIVMLCITQCVVIVLYILDVL